MIARILTSILVMVAITLALIVARFVYEDCCTPIGAAREAQRQAATETEKLPRKVNEADGCEVWAFKPGDRWLYFTRCGSKTTTDNAWETCENTIPGKMHTRKCTKHSLPITSEATP